MQPFSITCETCQARLKVRSESAIGQILSCPQCQSMVQITAPEGWSPEPSAATPETAQPELPSTTEPKSAPIAAPAEAATEASSSEVAASTAAAAPLPPPPLAVPATGLDPLDPSWASPVEQVWRKLILRSAAGGLGLLVIGGLIGYILTLRSDPVPVASLPVAPVPDPALDEEPEENANEGPAATPSPAQADQPSQEKLPSAVDVDNTAEENIPPAEKEPVAQEATEPEIEVKEPSEAEENLSKDPLPELEKTDKPTVSKAWVARRVPPTEEPTHTHDVASQLAEKIIRINFRDVPLAALLQFLSDMTALPITMDLPALASTGVSPQTRVSIQKEDTTVVEVLTAVLSQQGLTYLTQGDHLLVTSPSASSSKLRTLRYPIDDLASTVDTNAQTLAMLLQQMIEPSSWQTAGGPGSLQIEGEKLAIEQTMPVHQQLVTFCERLRVARGLPTRSRYSADRFRLTTRYSRASAVLANEVSFTFHEPTRLSDVVRHLESETGATVVVNWRSLVQEKFTFATRVECSIKEQTLESALRTMLPPLGLAWQSVDTKTVEILGRSDAEKKPIREFYPVAPLLVAGVHVEEILDQVRGGTGAELWDDQKGLGTLYFDQPSKHLVVRHNYAVQVRVQRLLAQLTDQLSDK